MPKLTADSFLNVLQQSDLIERDRIKSLMGKMQDSGIDVASSSAIGSWMVREGHLTDWQVDKLQKGKHKGFRLGKYRLRKLLGRGGMSSVYLAEHTLMRRPCAIKVLPIKKVNDSSYLARFHREAQAVASLDHPNIVRAYDIDKEVEKNQEIHFLIMEYVKGRDLQEVVKEDGPLSFEDAAEFCRQAALGLHHAHQSGLVHRDVKPGNLLLDENGVVKVLDLGLARFAEVAGNDEASLTVAHDEKVLGTADYLSPEQALDSHLVDNRADVYSLGCSMYFALTGRPPFNEGTIAQRLMWHQMKEPPEMNVTRTDVPESLAAIARKMMAKKPEDRYETMGDVASVLLNWLARNASADWKSKHAEILSGSDVAAPTAMPVSPVAAPVAPAAVPVAVSPVAAAPVAAPPVAPTAAPVVPAAAPAVDTTPIEDAVPIAGPADSTAPETPAAPAAPPTEGMFPGLPPAFDEPAATPAPVAEAEFVVEAQPAAIPPEATPAPSAAPVINTEAPDIPPAESASVESASVESATNEPPALEPATEVLSSATVASGASHLDSNGIGHEQAATLDVVDDTQVVGMAAPIAAAAEEARTADVDSRAQPAEVEVLPAASPAHELALDENAFPGLPDGATIGDDSVNEPTLITPVQPQPPAVSAADPVESAVAEQSEPEPAAAPVLPGPPVESQPAEFAPPDFNAAPPAEPSPFPDFSAQQAAPAAPMEPLPAQPISAVPIAETTPTPAAPQPAFDPTVPAPPPPAGGFDPTAGFSPDTGTAVAPPASARPKKKSGAPVGLIVGIIAALALGGGAFYMFGSDGNDDDGGGGGGETQSEGTGDGTSGQGGSTTGGSTKFLGYKLTVGPDGNFKTFSSLLKYLRDTKSSYRTSRRVKILVAVAAGKYSESLVVNNSDQKYPNGIQLTVEGDSPAVLAPSGNGPVVKLTDIENFRLEGFEIDAAGRDIAVELNGDVDRSTLKNVTITGYSKAGIHSNGASGSVDEECVIENVRFNPNGGNSVGIVFAESTTSRFHVFGCRFFGPQNSAIVFESSASFITVKDSIVEQAGMGMTFAGPDSNLRNISVFNNTFHNCSTAGIHFASAPSEESFGSTEIAIHRNIFSKLGGAEVIIEKGYEPKAFQKFVSSGTGGIQFNWSDRPTAANQTTEWEVILRPEQRVSGFQFVSTDRSNADFLRPNTVFTNFGGGGGSKPYPGAVQPK
jgi:serine/threonine protein kinase